MSGLTPLRLKQLYGKKRFLDQRRHIMDIDDNKLWKMAKARVEFKRHLRIYCVVNAFLWAVWLIGGRHSSQGWDFPWPIYPMFFWGIGLAFHYRKAYSEDHEAAVKKEYDNIKRSKKP
jgi:2TM domain